MMSALSEVLTDKLARRPGGWLGRRIYRRSAAHQRGFDLALACAPVRAGDRVLDVGCGGGAFLKQLLDRGVQAAGLDHSADMVAVAREQNAAAVAEGRADIREGVVSELPFADGSFSHVFCLHAFFFFPDPVRAIAEMARVLAPGGRLCIITASPAMEPCARWVFGPIGRRMRFDRPEDVTAWGAAAGLGEATVHDSAGGGYLHLQRKILPAGSAIEMPGFRGRVLGSVKGAPVIEGEITGPLPAHRATEGEFVYVMTGRLEVEVEGEASVLESGDYAFVPRGTLHAVTSAKDSRVLLFGL